MSNGFAKTNSDDPKTLGSLVPEALIDFDRELNLRLAKGSKFFGSVSLEVIFQNGSYQVHRVKSEYTGRPKNKP